MLKYHPALVLFPSNSPARLKPSVPGNALCSSRPFPLLCAPVGYNLNSLDWCPLNFSSL